MGRPSRGVLGTWPSAGQLCVLDPLDAAPRIGVIDTDRPPAVAGATPICKWMPGIAERLSVAAAAGKLVFTAGVVAAST